MAQWMKTLQLEFDPRDPLVQEENSKLSFTCRGTNTNKLFLKKVIWVIPILFKIL